MPPTLSLRLSSGPPSPTAIAENVLARHPPQSPSEAAPTEGPPFTYHQELELHIDGLTNLGLGVARHEGWVVMVPFVIPGERVRARIFRVHKTYAEADLLEVQVPSPDRVEPVCPLFGRCGGCQYQHLDYAAQLGWKRRHVEEVMRKIGKIEAPVAPAISSPRRYGYRSKLTPHYGRLREGKLGALGFLQFGHRQKLVDVPQCPIATSAINDALIGAKASVEARLQKSRRKPRGGTLLLRESADGTVATDPKEPVVERVAELEFHFTAGDFFQNNPFVLPRFVAYVTAQASAPLREEEPPQYLVDTYCGTGLFGLAAARSFREVVGIEISENATLGARANAARNGIANARFRVGTASAIFDGLDYPPEATTVLIDPPRKGCDADFREQLLRFAPARIVYVSCDPATQARDLAEFTAQGYEVEHLQPFDLFPQTRHIENVATLAAKSHTTPGRETAIAQESHGG